MPERKRLSGGVLSPILFNVYFDEMLQRLQDHDIDCHVGTKSVGVHGYADDLTLMSPSVWGLQKAVDICNNFALEKMMNSFKVIYIWKENS